MLPSSKYPIISMSLSDAPLVLSKTSCAIGFHYQILRRTFRLYLHARCKVDFVSPLNHREGKNSKNRKIGGATLL